MARSHRASLWARWALRDARRRWAQVLAIALLLALGVGFYAALGSMAVWRRDSADASFAALRMHDLRVSLPEGGTVRAGALRAALRRLPEPSVIAAAEERLVVLVQVDASARGRPILVPGRVVGAPAGGAVDTLDIRRGRALRAADDGRGVVELDYNFARHYALPAAGALKVTGGRAVRYVGQALGPEYFIVTAPGADFGAEAAFAVIFAPLRTAQQLARQPDRVNELVLRTRPGANVAALRRDLGRSLRVELPGIGVTLTDGHREPARRLIEKDAEGDQKMMDIFAWLLLGAATFAAFNLVSRTVEAQRREIGIGMALGVDPRVLARRPLLLGAQIALLGVALGAPVGLGANALLGGVVERFFPLPVVRPQVGLRSFAEAAILGLLLPLVATALPLRRALRVAPVEAIRVGARAARSSGLAWMLRGVRLPGGSLGNLPLRNVLRTPRRTLMTLLGIAAVVTIVIALSGLLDSFGKTLAASRSEALAGNPARLTVDLSAPQPAHSAVVGRIRHSPAVGGSQPSLRLAATLTAGGRDVDAFVEVVDPRGTLWHPTLTRGVLPAASPGLALSRLAADQLGVTIGDRLLVRHPVPTGPRSFALVTTPLRVTAVHASPFRFVAYANRPAGAALHDRGLVNRVSVIPGTGRRPDEVKRDLLRLPSVAAVQGAAATTDAVDQRMTQFTDILVITVTVAVLMALLIAYNSTSINTDERARENATMFAYGVGAGRVAAGSVLESSITGALGTLAGIAAGYGVLRWIVEVNMPATMPDVGMLVTLRPFTYMLAAVTGIAIVGLAPLMTVRRLRRTDIPSTLRVVE